MYVVEGTRPDPSLRLDFRWRWCAPSLDIFPPCRLMRARSEFPTRRLDDAVTASDVSITPARPIPGCSRSSERGRYVPWLIRVGDSRHALPSIHFIGLFMGLGTVVSLTLVVGRDGGVKSGLGWYVAWGKAGRNRYAKSSRLVIRPRFLNHNDAAVQGARPHAGLAIKGVHKW